MRLNPTPLVFAILLGIGSYLAFGSAVAGICLLCWAAFTLVITIINS